MKIDIMTLFPEMINAVMRESIIGRAQDKGVVEVKATNIRDYALDKHHKADDAPYGGGRGQVMLAEPLYLCHQALSAGEHVHTVFLSAQGQPFNQQKARELLAKEHFILVCGHYEGIDQRFIDECVDEEISIGDFVLTGGELERMEYCVGLEKLDREGLAALLDQTTSLGTVLSQFGVNQKGDQVFSFLQLCLRIGSSGHVCALGAVNENALGCYLRLLCLFLAVNDLGGLIGQNLFGLVDVRALKSAEPAYVFHRKEGQET